MKTYFEMTPREWSDLHATEGGGEQLTKQADKEACDINIIVKSYGTSNQFANVNPIPPRYQDNTAVVDLITARNEWNAAVEQFESLPANVRALADNDPIKFIQMLGDKENVEAFKKMGLPFEEEKPTPATEVLLQKLVENTTPKA